MRVLAELEPYDPVTSTRPAVRAASAQDRDITGLNNVRWWPAIPAKGMPNLAIRLFDGDFSADVEPGEAALQLSLAALEPGHAEVRRYLWGGAKLTLYAAETGTAWPWPVWFRGKTERFEVEGSRLKLAARVDTEPFEADVLTLRYAGTGGAEGGADLKNKPKPWLFGRAKSAEPVLVDAVDNVFQFSGYGPIQAVTALYERADDSTAQGSWGPSVGDFASYAALVAATIPAGRWGTCLAQGMIRLGAPPFGTVTGDVDGHVHSGTWLRKTGAIVERVALQAGVDASLIDSASLAALDAAVTAACPDGGNVNLYLTEQASVLDLARRLVRPCNAQAGVSWTGKLFAVRVEIGTPALTLDAQGRRRPPVTQSVEADVSPPYWRIEMGAERCWRVHTYDEIATAVPLVERGAYSASEWYRENNIVEDQGMSWRYVNATPGSGNAPPTLPTSSNAHWQALDPRLAGVEDDADNTANHTPNLQIPGSIEIAADSTGATTTALPLTVRCKAFEGSTDVSSTSAWSLGTLPPGIDATINNSSGSADRGVITLSDADAAGNIPVTVTIPGHAAITRQIPVVRTQAQTEQSGGSGAAIVNFTAFVNVTSGTHAAIASPKTVRSDGSGQLRYSALLNFRPTVGTDPHNIAAKLQYRTPPGSGSWNDFAAETAGQASDYDAELGLVLPGYCEIAETTKTGLTASTDYEVQPVARRATGTQNIGFHSSTATVRQ